MKSDFFFRSWDLVPPPDDDAWPPRKRLRPNDATDIYVDLNLDSCFREDHTRKELNRLVREYQSLLLSLLPAVGFPALPARRSPENRLARRTQLFSRVPYRNHRGF